jgi:hypothetical protein
MEAILCCQSFLSSAMKAGPFLSKLLGGRPHIIMLLFFWAPFIINQA